MQHRKWQKLLLSVMVGAFISTAHAHHATAGIDYGKVLTITATVKRLEWTNPHNHISLLVPSPSGEEQGLRLETGTIAINARDGWTKTIVKPGDKITIVYNPMKPGMEEVASQGSVRKMTLPDGRVLRGAADYISGLGALPFAAPPGPPPASGSRTGDAP